MPVGQMGKTTPRFLFGQHLDQQIEGVDRRQERQQMHPPKLGRAKESTSATALRLRELLVNPGVGNVGRESLEQCVGSSGWQQRIHGRQNYRKNSCASVAISHTHFSCTS